jgi:hypothetical protein
MAFRARPNLAAIAAALLACAGSDRSEGPSVATPSPTTGPAPRIHVQGNQLLDDAGRVVRLRGVNRSGTEYACAQGWGIFDGPADSASIRAIAGWRANAVRVPLNESCWLAINGVVPQYAGDNYKRAITNYVGLLNRNGFVAILDLHWTAAGSAKALGQAPMPNRDHTPDFWRSVAQAFGGNDAVVLDLFNEPYPDNNNDTPEAWRCWHDGGTCAGMAFQAASMQELVDAVRSTGANNVIMVGGVRYASAFSHWLENKPVDTTGNLAASWHVYNFGWCTTPSCWDTDATPVAAQVPLIVGEIGEDDGGSVFLNSLIDWMNARQASYLAWVWDVWGSSLDLIRSYDGTPTPYGQVIKTRIGG